MIRRLSKGLWGSFVLIVFLIMIGNTFLNGLIFWLLTENHWIKWIGLHPPGPFLSSPFLGSILISIIIGTSLTLLVGRWILKPITALNQATKQVAKADFSVRLSEKSGIEEINNMSKNFNRMVHELSGTETLRNDFISNVSHEFKNPLATIEGYATLIQDPTLSDDERQEYTHLIIESTHKLINLVSNILRLSKLENQQIFNLHEEFFLDEQIRMALLMLESQWSEKNLNLSLNMIPVKIQANEELLLQVWLNLIGNAIKFSHTDGDLVINLIERNRWVEVQIQDFGTGIDVETQHRIFEKFYQGDSSHQAQGNGLGLSIVQKVLELHGFPLEFHSEHGKGTSFIVSLTASSRQ